MLIDEIKNNWSALPTGYATPIMSLNSSEFRAWTIRTEVSCGVAIPLAQEVVIREEFANANLYSSDIALDSNTRIHTLVLMSGDKATNDPFAMLCREFVEPGPEGIFRKELTSDPTAWWREWKELLGNKNVDERVYDVIGELISLEYLLKNEEHAEWNGPSGATYDIDCDGKYVEVKSTTSRSRREITLSNRFQLLAPNNAELKLFFCQFEPAQQGLTIDSLVDAISSLGYSKTILNDNLEHLGLGLGRSSRKRAYMLHSLTSYDIDESFPAIRDSSFVGGTLPPHVQSLTYTLSLDGLSGLELCLEDQTNDVKI